MRYILSISFLLFFLVSNAQSNYPYQEISLEKAADFKTAEPFASLAANYLLTTPFKEKDAERENAFTFLIKWTAGNREYDFSLQGIIREMMEDRNLMQLFIPSMVKFCLENKPLGMNSRLIETSAVKTVLDYCNNPTNNFPLRKKTRKRLESN